MRTSAHTGVAISFLPMGEIPTSLTLLGMTVYMKNGRPGYRPPNIVNISYLKRKVNIKCL